MLTGVDPEQHQVPSPAALAAVHRNTGKHLWPELFDFDPNLPSADKKYKNWKHTSINLLNVVNDGQLDRLDCLINCNDFDAAIQILGQTYVKPFNIIYNRHVLATRHQQEGGTIDQYFETLHRLSKECNFQNATAEVYRQEYIRNFFINGIISQEIRQRLLENDTLTLDHTFKQARSLELAQRHSASYTNKNTSAAIWLITWGYRLHKSRVSMWTIGSFTFKSATTTTTTSTAGTATTLLFLQFRMASSF